MTPAAEADEQYRCPITGEHFQQPVLADDGFMYEKAALEQWLRQCGARPRSPKTNMPMGRGLSYPFAFYAAMKAWCRDHGVPPPVTPAQYGVATSAAAPGARAPAVAPVAPAAAGLPGGAAPAAPPPVDTYIQLNAEQRGQSWDPRWYNAATVQPLRCHGVPAGFTWRVSRELAEPCRTRAGDGTRPLAEYLAGFSKADLAVLSRSNLMWARVSGDKPSIVAMLCAHIHAAVRSGRTKYDKEQWNLYALPIDGDYRLVTMQACHYLIAGSDTGDFGRYYTKQDAEEIARHNGWAVRATARSTHFQWIQELRELIMANAPAAPGDVL